MPDDLRHLAEVIAKGLPVSDDVETMLGSLFGSRYNTHDKAKVQIRDALRGGSGEQDGVPFAGFIHRDTTHKGPYGGTSWIWFPSTEGSILTFVVGTQGLPPDEGLLSRPGHHRRLVALRRYLTQAGVYMWTKEDPTAIQVDVPDVVKQELAGFSGAFKKYGRHLYAIARVPSDPIQALDVVQSFLDVYAYERGIRPLAPVVKEWDELQSVLDANTFRQPSPEEVYNLLQQRRFVVLQGPPGTGKTRMAGEITDKWFGNRGMTVQFHPAVTYEDFIVGLSPEPKSDTLHFKPRKGWLLQAATKAESGRFLLTIDEINRADLGKVLGEAIYLFEPREVGGENARTITLPHELEGEGQQFRFPENLYVLATMNTADRSIARMDLAVRRRFAFVKVPPNPDVVNAEGLPRAQNAFGKLFRLFVEHAPNEALDLLPGHSYFLADSEAELTQRFRFELLPLLDEYLAEGFLGSFAAELKAVRDAIEDECGYGATNS